MTFEFYDKSIYRMKIDTPTPTHSLTRIPALVALSARRWLILATLAICGCASPPAPHLHVSADAVINRDSGGAPLSVVVRTYQLSDRKQFDRLALDLVASGRTETEMLGDQLLSQQEFVVTPGTSVDEPFSLAAETRYVGIVGFFLKPDAHAWRLLVNAAEVRKRGLRFAVRDCYLVGESPAALSIPGHGAERKPRCDDDSKQALTTP